MPIRPLPDRPSLENLRKQAKGLLAAVRRETGLPATGSRPPIRAGSAPAARAGRPWPTPSWGFTALHWAAFRADLATMRVLLDRDAPLDARNAYGGTVLEGTRWAAENAPVAGADYPAAIALLEPPG